MSEQEVLEPEVVEETRQLPAVRQSEAMIAKHEVGVEDVVAGHEKIVAVMNAVMKEDVHYGKIPGVNKPTLLKPGAEVLNVTLRLAPDYESEKVFGDDGHLTVISKCTLRHIPTQLVIASGEGMCSTRESKYAYRQGQRLCPQCGKATVRKGKARGNNPANWYCWNKAGVSDGCGATWDLNSEQGRAFDQMDTGRVANEDLPDSWNTVLKMADKRALIAAVLNGTAASDVFTQDVEDQQTTDAQRSAEPVADAQPAASATDTQSDTSGLRTDGFKMPGTWAKIEEAIRAFGDSLWLDWLVFAQQARDHLFPDGNVDKTKMRGITGVAAKVLRDSHDPSSFPPPDRAALRNAWQTAIPNVQLEGPEWRMDPSENDRADRPTPLIENT